MGFFGETGDFDDPIAPALQGAKLGYQIGRWMGVAFGLVVRVTILAAVAGAFAARDGANIFVRRFIAGWNASKP